MTPEDDIKTNLANGYGTAGSIAEQVGLDEGTIRRRLRNMEGRGEVENFRKGNTLFWRLREPGAGPAVPAGSSHTPAAGDRVALAEELVRCERRIAEIIAELSR